MSEPPQFLMLNVQCMEPAWQVHLRNEGSRSQHALHHTTATVDQRIPSMRCIANASSGRLRMSLVTDLSGGEHASPMAAALLLIINSSCMRCDTVGIGLAPDSLKPADRCGGVVEGMITTMEHFPVSEVQTQSLHVSCVSPTGCCPSAAVNSNTAKHTGLAPQWMFLWGKRHTCHQL
jgi:hypothetical protein